MQVSTLIHHRLFAWGVIVFTGVMAFSMIGNFWRLTHQVDHTPEQAAQIEALEKQADQLSTDIQTESSSFTLEEVIRNQLNMQKTDEIIIQLPPLPTPTPFPTPNPSPTPKIYQQWLSVFRGN